MKEPLSVFLQRTWYGDHPLCRLLTPLSGVTAAAVAARRAWFRRVKPATAPLPVIVVGGLTVGGTGKTPLVAALAEYLKSKGRKPGIVSRGYGARRRDYPYRVQTGDSADQVGDEPLLLRRRTGCPVVIDPDRRRAVVHLAEQTDADIDIVVSDDGLQHYRLHRDVEIAVIDGRRGFGNGKLLPAGPLREPRSRLAAVDAIVVNGDGEAFRDAARIPTRARWFSMTIKPLGFENLATGEALPPDAFAGRVAHACAGIGDPRRFFDVLAELGVRATPHVYPDHHRYRSRDLVFTDAAPVIVTEKDAVKCRDFPDSKVWFLKVEAVLEDEFWEGLDARLARKIGTPVNEEARW